MLLMPAKKKSRKPVRSGLPVHAYVDPDVRAAMDRFIDDHNSKQEHRASVTSTLEAALKAYLAGKGFWPPSPPPARPRGA